MAATTVRDYLAEAIQAAAPKWTVHAYPDTPENVRRGQGVVSIWRSDIQPGSSELSLDHLVTVNVYGARTGEDALEVELEGNHDLVLVALQRLPHFTWTRSTRTSWRDGTLAGWQITGTVSTSNIYREAINAERTTP